ncbi:phage antirepressor N-terminal domain-containing protein [Gilliamella intestini]|uniref:ORF6C domain-containing protein n=1 Tax=Gilliamella intestini TaxID=1798183 RepID=A0A1C4D6H7_9GAMM|nr:phage antirepressor N-terminal domain-containing protein [Gilliamella intestini]SCC26828.1 ORF6C domain-containing protein [Gilliamella intestini]
MSNTKLETIQFHNQQLIVLNYKNKPYIAMKPVCENIGLDWAAQLKRIKRHQVLSSGMVMMTTPSKQGLQEYVCLPISMINGWLFGIETSRVKPEIRATLEQYQLECFDVLYNHFMPKVAQQYPHTISLEQQQQIKQAVNERSYRTGEHYQAIYTKLYEQFKIPRYQDLPLNQFDNAIEFLGGLLIKPEALTGDELCDFAWLYKAAEHMRREIEEIEPALRVLKSEKASLYYTMSREYRNLTQLCKKIVQSKMKSTQINKNDLSWQRVLPYFQ